MDDRDGSAERALQILRERFGDRDRAMTAARAADRDREVTLSLALVPRHHVREEILAASHEFDALGQCQHPACHPRVVSRQWLELRYEVGIVEETYVEDEV